MEIEVINSIEPYVKNLETIFDFDIIKKFSKHPNFKFTFDAMHGVSGPYAEYLFRDYLQIDNDKLNLMRCNPLEDFGGCHPDPNLIYADQLVKEMFSEKNKSILGAACDGDADRNMILGDNFFLNPSDSVALIASLPQSSIPKVAKNLTGVARSMPTSSALDRVAKKNNLKCFEVPTGWKFFGNLMDADLIQICGEES